MTILGAKIEVSVLLGTFLIGVGVAAESDAYTLIGQGRVRGSILELVYGGAQAAQVFPLGDDPLRICMNKGGAFLLGRNTSTYYVLLRETGHPGGIFVLPLRTDQYAVATGSSATKACSSTAPALP